MPEIIGFADIGEFVYMPVKYYSSGMLARLAFSVAMAIRPDIFLVDEVLAVGDQTFRDRCVELMETYIDQGLTLVVVTHELDLVHRLATRAIWLHEGRIRMEGNPQEVVAAYEAHGRRKREIQRAAEPS